MSRFGDLLGGKKPASSPAPVAPAPSAPTPPAPVEVDTPEAISIAPEEVVEEEEVVDETSDLSSMSKNELEAYGRELGVELDRRHSKKRLISEIEEILDNS
tara:strand:- start:341 stop:643 length:303 start_codon:yes stop_codon:yes gene_type:complete